MSKFNFISVSTVCVQFVIKAYLRSSIIEQEFEETLFVVTNRINVDISLPSFKKCFSEVRKQIEFDNVSVLTNDGLGEKELYSVN